ncbi:MAG: hypothetical protein HC844_21785 [Tabrizicola sp.]|nr:hypothetical protein [Tabrizicola sp.]
MSKPRLTETGIRAGVWEGELIHAGPTPPAVEVLHEGRPLDGVTTEPLPDRAGTWRLRVPIPLTAIDEGVQTFLIRVQNEVLARFAIVAGQPLDADLRVEIDLLRAELEVLKRAFRTHCAKVLH